MIKNTRNQKPNKLKLHHETVRVITESGLSAVVGGTYTSLGQTIVYTSNFTCCEI